MASGATRTNGTGKADRGRGVDRDGLPRNLEAERSILGGVILESQTLAHLDTLEVEHFFDWKNQVVWQAIRSLQSQQQPIDVVTIANEIEKQGRFEAVGYAYLGELATHVPTASNVIAYARIVRERYVARTIAQRAHELYQRCLKNGDGNDYDVDELLAEARATFGAIEQRHTEESEDIPVITVDGALDELERLARTPVYETPFPELNKLLGFDGMLGGQVYYLAGGTGFGKTSFIGKLARCAASQGRRTIIAFWEMFAAYYVARMSASVVGVHANRILRGGVDRKLIKSSLAESNIELLDSPTGPVLRRLVDRHVRAGHGAPLIVVDYIQLLADAIMATQARPDPRLANAQASAMLRTLAKETGAVIVAVSAAGRSASKKLAEDVRKKPARDLIDASRESGSIEFDGAGVIVLSVSSDKDGDEDVATISLAKARFGETHHIDARYDGRTGEWREIGRVVTVPKTPPTKPDDGSVFAAIVAVLRKHGPQRSKTKIYNLAQADGHGKGKQAIMSEIDGRSDASVGDLVLHPVLGYALPEHVAAHEQGPAQASISGVEP